MNLNNTIVFAILAKKQKTKKTALGLCDISFVDSCPNMTH